MKDLEKRRKYCQDVLFFIEIKLKVLFYEMHNATQGHSKQRLFRTTTWKAWRRISDYQEVYNKDR